MNTFWFFGAALVALALLFFWIPFFKRPKADSDAVDRNALNVEIFKSRLAELEQELRDDNLDQAGFDELKTELEKSLLEEVVDEQPPLEHHRPGIWLPLGLTLLVPLLAVVLYLQWGALDDLGKPPSAATADEHQQTDMQQQVEQLRARLEASPEDPEGWFMLGRSYMAMERYADSAMAFERLTQMVGEHPEILGQHANALYFQNNHRITPEAQALIDRALALNPNDAGTISLLGMAAYEAGEYLKAYDHWQQLLNSNQPGVNREALMAAISQVQKVMDEQGIEYPELAAASAAGDVALQVEVNMDPALMKGVSPDTVVFVLAQPAEGPRMPLAAVKLMVSDLPTTVTLDDSRAMGPMAKLSSADTVLIRALVSMEGTASAQPGDLYGMTPPVSVKGNDQLIKLNIDRTVQ